MGWLYDLYVAKATHAAHNREQGPADVPEHAAARGVLGGSFSARRSRVAGQGRGAVALG
jgi:hypothetical protein